MNLSEIKEMMLLVEKKIEFDLPEPLYESLMKEVFARIQDEIIVEALEEYLEKNTWK